MTALATLALMAGSQSLIVADETQRKPIGFGCLLTIARASNRCFSSRPFSMCRTDRSASMHHCERMSCATISIHPYSCTCVWPKMFTFQHSVIRRRDYIIAHVLQPDKCRQFVHVRDISERATMTSITSATHNRRTINEKR